MTATLKNNGHSWCEIANRSGAGRKLNPTCLVAPVSPSNAQATPGLFASLPGLPFFFCR
jgi:hypothetical protein